jgi:hypothetical protein
MRIDEFFQQHSLKLLAIGRRAEEQDAAVTLAAESTSKI